MKVAIFGCGGHGATVADAMHMAGQLNDGLVFLDDNYEAPFFMHDPVVGGSEMLEDQEFVRSHAVIIGVGDPHHRKRLAEMCVGMGGQFTNAIHPGSHVSEEAQIMAGTYIAPGAIVGPKVWIGRHNIINLGASVAHGSQTEDFVSVNDGVRVGGDVKIEELAYLGMNSVILPKRTVGHGGIVGAGAVVTKDVEPNRTVVGVPAAPLIRDNGK